MLSTLEYKKLVNKCFGPILRDLGFQGTGFNYRKITGNHYIYAFRIQADQYGDGTCSAELGVYIDFIPNNIGKIVAPNKVAVYDCDFRRWIVPEVYKNSWNYGDNQQDAFLSINHMIHTFEENGLPFFQQFIDFPNPLISITIEDIVNKAPKLKQLAAPTNLRIALNLARIHAYLGNDIEALKFCEWGLNNIGRATLLIEEFEGIQFQLRQGSFA